MKAITHAVISGLHCNDVMMLVYKTNYVRKIFHNVTKIFVKVVGHRPVCSCPSGTQNINSSCTSDTSCQWGPGTQRLGSGEHYYEPSCEQRYEYI